MGDEERPSWIDHWYWSLDRLAKHCVETSTSSTFETAVDDAIQRSRAWKASNECLSIDSALTPLNDKQKRLLIGKIAQIEVSFTSLSLRLGPEEPGAGLDKTV